MYTVTSSVFVHFAHHVRGHDGPCISLHGHTWKFEVTLQADKLDQSGFVYDFDALVDRVLTPVHQLLDHGLAVGADTWAETRDELAKLGETLVASRKLTLGNLGEPQEAFEGEMAGARNERPGGIKVVVFPFAPTSELLAEWLYRVTTDMVADERITVRSAKVYETMHPIEMVAEYRPS